MKRAREKLFPVTKIQLGQKPYDRKGFIISKEVVEVIVSVVVGEGR